MPRRGRRRATWMDEPELIVFTPGLRWLCVSAAMVLFLAGTGAGFVVGANL